MAVFFGHFSWIFHGMCWAVLGDRPAMERNFQALTAVGPSPKVFAGLPGPSWGWHRDVSCCHPCSIAFRSSITARDLDRPAFSPTASHGVGAATVREGHVGGGGAAHKAPNRSAYMTCGRHDHLQRMHLCTVHSHIKIEQCRSIHHHRKKT